MHGDRTQNQRNQALTGFRDGRYRILVATDVAARGIHIDGVAHVVNYDLPQAPTDFIHRVGRTGRAGQRGAASTFSTKSERSEVRRIEQECKVSLERRTVAAEIVREANESAQMKIHADTPAPNKDLHRSFSGHRGGKQKAGIHSKRRHRSR
jgi:ATP-dependent RNA helicase RhlE